jgi:cysteine-rich repeat protein
MKNGGFTGSTSALACTADAEQPAAAMEYTIGRHSAAASHRPRRALGAAMALAALLITAPVAADMLVGSYEVDDGPNWTTNPPTYTCQEACAVIFGGTAADYSCSTSNSVVTHDNHTTIWGISGCPIAAENFKINVNYNCGFNNCAQSAYTDDNCFGSSGTNYCWAVTDCGNGTIDSGEQCDDGNFVNGDCCSSTCQYEAASSPCDVDANVCTTDQCDGSGVCGFVGNASNTTACDLDSNLCTTDLCDGAGACAFQSNVSCQAASPPCEAGEMCNPTTGMCDPLPDPFFTPCEADSNLCTSDFCNGAGTCQTFSPVFCSSGNPPCDGGEICNPGTGACDPQPDAALGTACESDGDSCTIDQCNGTGGCVVKSEPFGCVDHYLCYKSKATSAFAGLSVTLADEFETSTAEVKRPKALCLPADKNDEGRIDPDTHEESYGIKTTPKHVAQAGVRVLDQFGQLTVDTIKSDRLLVPTNKALGSDPSPPVPGVANHFECYKVKISHGTPKFAKGVQASVVDQFEDRIYDVKKPRHLCVPVDKDGSGITHEGGHLMCYKAKATTPHTKVTGQIHTANQFGLGQLDTIKEEELCVPALAHVQDSPAAEDLTTCSPGVRDTWQFLVSDGQTVHLKADTVDAASAADLCLFTRCSGTGTFSADDNMACTFPPPSFACPDVSFVASADGLCTVTVRTCSSSCADAATARYSLSVTLDGSAAVVGPSEDDAP